MSIMTEKKAKELFAQYMQAEASGNDVLAIQLEGDLNKGGWYITSGQDGLTVSRKETNMPSVNDFLFPKESNVVPSPVSENPNAKMWRTIGISVLIVIGVVLLVFATRKVIQVIKNKKNAT